MFITYYQPYKELVLVSTHLQVTVDGLTTLQMQNDETVLQANKPFEPFGTSPAEGSRFSIGHPEVVRNTLDSLKFTIEWMGVPQEIAEHYQNYPEVPQKGNGVFTARVSLVDKRRDVPLNDDAAPLFNTPDARARHTLRLDVSQAYDRLDVPQPYERYPEMVLGDDLRTWDRYLQWSCRLRTFSMAPTPEWRLRKRSNWPQPSSISKPGHPLRSKLIHLPRTTDTSAQEQPGRDAYRGDDLSSQSSLHAQNQVS